MITNIKNGKRYIGKTVQNINKRWYQHCKNAEYGHDTYLYKSIRKYGKDSFVVEKLCDGLDEEEVVMIESYNPEYNLTRGGTGGDTSNSPNYILGMSKRDFSGSNNPNYGKRGKDSPNFGKKRTEAQKQNIRNSEYLSKKRKPVEIDGVLYESVYGAAQALGRSERYIRLHDTRNEWSY